MDEAEMKRRVTRTLESRKSSFGALIEGDGAKPPPEPDDWWQKRCEFDRRTAEQLGLLNDVVHPWHSLATPAPAELSRMDIYGDEPEETP